MVNLQGLAFSKNQNDCHFMNHRDKAFKSLHNATNNLSKQLLAAGVGAVKQQARVITEKEEYELREKGIMGRETPDALLNAIFFNCGIRFCLRSGAEHRDLKFSQIKLEEVTDS